MTTPMVEAVSIEAFDYIVPCGIDECTHSAEWMSFGEHSRFGCPGHGALCEFHRKVTVNYVTANAGKAGRCKCGEHRVQMADEVRFLAL